ncbi:unnamed protein product [Adineta ricciae]|uniref:Uncharacterized protein n=1 Tax=Adineta ricciae TaxID=249248 RepID=A0A815F3Q3_ADIRI|nr:unnamed protein product [Adineta ricciae]
MSDMEFDDSSLPYVFIICGNQKSEATQLTARSSIEQIHETVRSLFGSSLPDFYHLKLYSGRQRKFITLNDNIMDSADNPFVIKTECSNDGVSLVKLYVDEISNTHDECLETSSSQINATAKESDCQIESPVDSHTTEDNANHNEDLSRALVSRASSTDMTRIRRARVKGNLNARRSLRSFRDTNFSTTTNSHMMHAPKLPSSNSTLNSNTSMNNNSFYLTSANEVIQSRSQFAHSVQQPVQPQERSNMPSDRLCFTHDVKPIQKRVYVSDEYNQRDESKRNGSITYIQGVKNNSEDRSSIPNQFITTEDTYLVIYAVREVLGNGKIIWFKHANRHFLTKDWTGEPLLMNPVELKLHGMTLSNEGDFTLKLQMVSRWDKHPVLWRIHELDEPSAKRLHPANHNSSAPRLFCFIRQGSSCLWDTMCLSDFIRWCE